MLWLIANNNGGLTIAKYFTYIISFNSHNNTNEVETIIVFIL